MMKQVCLFLAAMLLLCLAPMPYGYFQLVRFVAMVAFGLMAYRYYQCGKRNAAVGFAVLALLFQPFAKVALGRGLWNVVDVVVAALLVAICFWGRRRRRGCDEQEQKPLSSALMEGEEVEMDMGCQLLPNELVYVAKEENGELENLFEQHPEVLEEWGQTIGFQIVYLPLLLKKLKEKRVLRYRAPYLTDAELSEVAIGNDFLLKFLERPADKDKVKQGFLRTENAHKGNEGEEKAKGRFYPLTSKGDVPLSEQLQRIGRQISWENARTKKRIEADGGEQNEFDDSPANQFDDSFAEQFDDSTTDQLIEEVRERVAQLRQRGIAEYVLEQLIHPDDRLSRMLITKDGRILLPDYNHMEIKMEPLVKAVYLLFLRHSEGIVFKQLPEYRTELTEIYSWLRPSGLTPRALQSIADVTNPTNNSINEKCTRIRAAFVGEFDEYMAKSYYIDGPRGDVKKIALPRNLVVWE
jgi:hypothetical protein